ncbi:MAG: conjugal transfer protein TraD [Candidatus Binataceae bacterium]
MSYEQRKLDTRRKIALGGLVVKAGLDREDPSVLLGMLMAAARVLASADADEHRKRWRERGDSAFKGT